MKSLFSRAVTQSTRGFVTVSPVRLRAWQPFHWIPKHKRKAREQALAAKEQAKLEAQGRAEKKEDIEAAEEEERIRGAQLEEAKPIMTTPYQAVQLLRAFDPVPNNDKKIHFSTDLDINLKMMSVRGICNLPHGTGADLKILAVCRDNDAEEMLAAGAHMAGVSEPIAQIKAGKINFDRCITTPEMMKELMDVARILGPKRLMPNARSGTVVRDLPAALRDATSGTQMEYRAEGAGATVKVPLATSTLNDAQILDNVKHFVGLLRKTKPKTTSDSGASSLIPVNTPTEPNKPGIKANPAIPGAKGGVVEGNVGNQYFLKATLEMENGARINLDPHTILPNSTGYFR